MNAIKNIVYSIVIPCYNESDNIPLLLGAFDKAISLDFSNHKIELILVDNGSTDNTQEVLQNILFKYSFAKSIKVDHNKGYGYGIKQGLMNACGEILAYTHADLQTPPSDVLKGFSMYQKGDFIKGNRKGRSIGDAFFTFGMSIFESLLFGTKLYDINAQPTIFSRSFFESIAENIPLDFSLDLYLYFMAKKRHQNIVRFNVAFPKRLHGVSSWNTSFSSKWRFIKRTIAYSLILKSKL